MITNTHRQKWLNSHRIGDNPILKRKRRPLGKNDERADWAQIAVDAFTAEVGSNGDDRESRATDVQDMLCDLQHLCDREGFDFDGLLEKARWHYEYEVETKGDPNE